jgi:hypothetical protein
MFLSGESYFASFLVACWLADQLIHHEMIYSNNTTVLLPACCGHVYRAHLLLLAS